MPREPNLMAKTRKVNDPYAIWVRPGWEWRVLKHYQTPQKEADNLAYARCFCAVKGPGTFDSYDMGDTYIRDYEAVAYPLTAEEMVDWLADPKNHWREY